jgi:chromosome segregation ATPase
VAVEDVREAVTAARREVLADPLVHDPRRPVDPAVLAALAERVRALRDDADGAVHARDDRPARRRRLAEALDALEAEEAAAHEVAARVAREIAEEHHGAPPARADALRALPDGIEAELDVVEAEVAAAAHTARRARAERAGLLERRDELAGRLTALGAKATATGRAADPVVAARRREARDRLAAVPCDLAAATVAVRAYQRALEGPGDEVSAGARPSDGTDPGHRRVDRAQPGPRV